MDKVTGRKIITILLIAAMLLGITGCSAKRENTIATAEAEKQVKILSASEIPDAEELVPDALIDPIEDWDIFDALIAESQTELDFERRAELLQKAEDYLMATHVVLPVNFGSMAYLRKDYVEDLYVTTLSYPIFAYAKLSDGRDTFRLSYGGEPDYMDPTLGYTAEDLTLAMLTSTGLYIEKSEEGYTECLAERMEVSEDGLTYTVILRENLRWSDGTPLTAADFAYAWQRAIDPMTAADFEYFYAGFDGYDEGKLNVTAVDDRTLVFVMKSPCAYIKSLLANQALYPVKQSAVEAEEGWESSPGKWASKAGFVSSGPYILTEWKHDMYMVMEKNPYYWDAENITIERIEIMLSDDTIAAYAAYNAGDLDLIENIPSDELTGLIESGSSELQTEVALGTDYVIINPSAYQFEGKTTEEACLMRMALSLLIDRKYICDNIQKGGQIPAAFYIPPGISDGNGGVFHTDDWEGYYNPTAINDDYEGTLALARMYLQAAGFSFDSDGTLSDETPLSFEIYCLGDSTKAEAMQQDFAVLGIETGIRTEESSIFYETLMEGEYEICLTGWYADFDDPCSMLEIFTTDSTCNEAGFGKNRN